MKSYIILLMLILNTAILLAQAPVVENVRIDQRLDGSLAVDIYYDVIDADGDSLEITIEASNDNGQTWTLPCVSLTGDIGEGIIPGTDKHVVWDFYADNPNVRGSNYRIRVTADDKIVVDIDGNRYRYITIGNQVWMVENLLVTHFRNGDPIPNVSDQTEWSALSTGAYCNYQNNINNAETYGRLYNWYAVDDSREIAPAGWHVPTDAEWKELEMFLGMSQSETNNEGLRGTDEGCKLKEEGTSHWNSPNSCATNESGFTALPGGYRYDNGAFYYMGAGAFFWSSTGFGGNNPAWYRFVDYVYSGIYRYLNNKSYGYSVRCVRDAASSALYLDVYPSSLSVGSSSGSERSFTVSSNTNWWVSDNADWLIKDPISGSGDGAIDVITTGANSSESVRVGYVTVSGGTGVNSKTVTVTQAGHINAPPVACGTRIECYNYYGRTSCLYDASCSSDAENSFDQLQFRWKWEEFLFGDYSWHTFQTEWSFNYTHLVNYGHSMVRPLILEVKDTGGLIGSTEIFD